MAYSAVCDCDLSKLTYQNSTRILGYSTLASTVIKNRINRLKYTKLHNNITLTNLTWHCESVIYSY